MLAKPLVIVSTGNGARIALDVARALGMSVKGFISSEKAEGEFVNGLPVLGADSLLHKEEFISENRFVVPIGPLLPRKRIALQLIQAGADLATLVHPSCVVSPFAAIGVGSVIVAGAIVNCNVTIGRFCIINAGTTIEHDSILEDGVLISPGVHFGGGTYCAEGSFVGIGACTKAGIRIGRNALVGAGAVVIKDVEDDAIVAGNPARPLASS
jgi:sugar O-acyltransferase (sialic acid O-acetyltransferase NeuD family)